MPGFTFTPSLGHLRAGSSRPITATFLPTEPAAHDPLELSLAMQPIKYASEVPRDLDWDVALGSEEPPYAPTGGAAKAVPLRVYAVADSARFECDLKPVNFRPTMMFQTRSHAFTVKARGFSQQKQTPYCLWPCAAISWREPSKANPADQT